MNLTYRWLIFVLPFDQLILHECGHRLPRSHVIDEHSLRLVGDFLPSKHAVVQPGSSSTVYQLKTDALEGKGAIAQPKKTGLK